MAVECEARAKKEPIMTIKVVKTASMPTHFDPSPLENAKKATREIDTGRRFWCGTYAASSNRRYRTRNTTQMQPIVTSIGIIIERTALM